jgi:thermitase
VANGIASLTARAYDAAGNGASSAVVSVNVANAIADTTPPSVSISSPVNGTTVSGVVGVSVSASDNAGAAGIAQTLYINGAKVASATGGSLGYRWNVRKVASGTYTLQAVARDAAGNTSTQSIQVRKR